MPAAAAAVQGVHTTDTLGLGIRKWHDSCSRDTDSTRGSTIHRQSALMRVRQAAARKHADKPPHPPSQIVSTPDILIL